MTTLTWAAFRPLTLELAVLAVTLLVFTADLLLSRDEKRGLGALTVMGLAAVLLIRRSDEAGRARRFAAGAHP